jgi:uncharacterized membrane protein
VDLDTLATFSGAEFLTRAFGLVCGQHTDHTWAPGGLLLPFCQRCTGLYGGAALTLVLLLVCRPALTGWFLRVHGLFLLAMAPFGFHWVPQGPEVRTLTGWGFGAGLVVLLWWWPGERWGRAGNGARRVALYFIGLAAGCGLMLAAASQGGDASRTILAGAGWLGLVALAALGLVNLLLALVRLCSSGWGARRSRGSPSGSPEASATIAAPASSQQAPT